MVIAAFSGGETMSGLICPQMFPPLCDPGMLFQKLRVAIRRCDIPIATWRLIVNDQLWRVNCPLVFPEDRGLRPFQGPGVARAGGRHGDVGLPGVQGLPAVPDLVPGGARP